MRFLYILIHSASFSPVKVATDQVQLTSHNLGSGNTAIFDSMSFSFASVSIPRL